jgi:hypothetical protein
MLGRKSYLTSRDELKRAQGSLQVLGVALKVEKSVGEGGLQLRRALPRGRVGSDFVDGSHDVCAKRRWSLLRGICRERKASFVRSAEKD